MNDQSVIIVGSGIAGSTLAFLLTRAGFTVTIYEKGPRFPYPHSQQFAEQVRYLYQNPKWDLPDTIKHLTLSGDYAKDLNAERGMVVGGSATHWWGTTPRMTPVDFRTRSEFGYGLDWPVTYEEIEPYYCKAERHIGISGTVDDNPFAPPRSEPYPLPPFALSHGDQVLADRLEKNGLLLHTTPQARVREGYDGRPACVNFGACNVCPIGARYSPTHHLNKAIETGRCRVEANMTVRRILVNADGRASGVHVQPNEGGSGWDESASIVIVAAGGLETPRLLLLSAQDTAHPLGNQGNQVGRNLTFHHIWSAGLRFDRLFYKGRVGPATGRSFQFISPETRGRHGGISVGLDDRVDVRWFAGGLGYWSAQSGDDLVDGMRDQLHTRSIQFHAESIPAPTKYVELSEERDEFGDPFAHVHYESSDFDRRTFAYAQELYDKFSTALNAQVEGQLTSLADYDSGAHHMGTCQMGTDPATSVVDSFGRVHGTKNVFLAGSSIFVGGSGAIQPTLTLTAFAIRTAEYIIDTYR